MIRNSVERLGLMLLIAAFFAVVSLATDMDHKGRVVATVVTAHSGTAEVTCNHPGGWQFDVLSTEDCGRDVVTVRVSSPTNAMPPSFGVFFRVPGAGVQNVWISDYERTLWGQSLQTLWGQSLQTLWGQSLQNACKLPL